MNGPTILFDGVCNLCNGFVQFIIERDKQGKFKFASLQSAYAKNKLETTGVNSNELSTVVFIKGDQIYTKSTAALKIAKELGGAWALLYSFIIIPKFLRDGIYNLVAKNRYKWFGQQESCMLPTPELKGRFLD